VQFIFLYNICGFN